MAPRVAITVPRAAVLAALCLALAGGATAADPGTGPTAAPPRLVVLVRHAETDPEGGSDPGLSDAGRARAEALADALADAGVGAIVTSTLKRAQETAAPLAEALGLAPIAVSVTREGGLAGHVQGVVDAVRAAPPGATVLVVGHANTVPAVLAALGGPEIEQLPDDDHSSLFLLFGRDVAGTRLVRSRFGPPADAAAPPATTWDPRDPCPGVELPDQATSPYVLPYPVGTSRNVRQGNCNTADGHHDGFNERFAHDFEMPIGSAVVAARGGRVFAVVESFTDEQHEIGEANFVAVDHGDGTYAGYAHLTRDGALVAVGDVVKPGQPLGLSGNSGMSRGPHLHFSVKRCPPDEPLASPACTTIPITFRNTRPHPRGLVGSATAAPGGGEWYEAHPFEGPFGGKPRGAR